MRHSIFLLLVIINWQAHAQNLLNNGSFEFGGSGVGFVVDGSGYNLLSPPFLGNTNAGDYAFISNPQQINTQYFISSGDHTNGLGKMIVIDGTTNGGQQRFWNAGNNGGGVCNLVVGQTYTFKYWIRSVSSTNSNSDLANIGVSFGNANNIKLVSGTSNAPISSAGWQEVVYSFEPTNACVNIGLYNNNTNLIGNDFAIDDLSVLGPPQPLSSTFSVTQPNCSGENSGLIAIYPKGGVAPYSFTLSGGYLTKDTINKTGVFTNLPGGTYSYSVKDHSNAESKEQNIQLNSISPLVISPQDTSICPNEAVKLTVTGGTSNYSWTSSNSSEIGFPALSSSVMVSPSSSTTYTVTAQVNKFNLIYNGDFEQGNVGFRTDYKFYEPDKSGGAKRAYGVFNNPKVWFNEFSLCEDHTSGTGKNMMILDGSTFNKGTDVFWCQQIAVQPNKNYTFSYWVTSVSLLSPAKIKSTLNGVTLGSFTVPVAQCDWKKETYNWNSSNNTVAEICLTDENYEGIGNDFAIDDISFETTTCSKDVVVTLKNILSPPKISGDNLVCLNSNPEAIQVQNPQGTINWYADENLNSLILTGNSILPSTKQNGIYYATETINDCESKPTAFQLTVNPCEVVIPSAFTPNNDLENDFWELVNLDLNYPKNKVKIFNRWGNLLFESPPGKYSEKPWDGKYQDKQLPVGSYFYVIDLSDDGSIEPLNGSVSIILKR